MEYTVDAERRVMGKTGDLSYSNHKITLVEKETFTQTKKDLFVKEAFELFGDTVIELVIVQGFRGKPSSGSSWQSSCWGTKYTTYKRNLGGKWFLVKSTSKVEG